LNNAVGYVNDQLSIAFGTVLVEIYLDDDSDGETDWAKNASESDEGSPELDGHYEIAEEDASVKAKKSKNKFDTDH